MASSAFDGASIFITPSGYKASVLYPTKPLGTNNFTVTRSTTATRVNASGLIESVASGVPRLDYTGGGCPALLVEPAATNLALRSEEFDNAYWTKNNATIGANAAVAPDGASNADKLIANNLSTSSSIERAISGLTASATYTVSFFFKKGEADWIRVVASPVSGGISPARAWFNATTGALGTNNGGFSRISTKDYGNGWYRAEATVVTSGTSLALFFAHSDADNNNDFAGDGTSGTFFYGAQLETGSVATSYIPTVATTQTRNADAISLSSVSGLIGQTEGTLYAEVDLKNWEASNRIFAISDNTSSNRIIIIINTSQRLRAIASVGGVSQFDFNTNTLSNGVYKIAVAYANNDFAFYVNGVQIATSTSGLVPACTNVYIGKLETSSSTLFLNDRISAAAIYTTRLSNSELASLTTL